MGELYFYRYLKDENSDESDICCRCHDEEDATKRFYNFVDAYFEESKDIIYNCMWQTRCYEDDVAELILEILDGLEAFRDRELYERAYKQGRTNDPIRPNKLEHVLCLASQARLTNNMKKILNDVRDDIFTLLCEVIKAENNLCLKEATYIHKDKEIQNN